MPREPMFGIFRGAPDAELSWIASVEGLERAKALMGQVATEKPGPYFILDWRAVQVLARIDTRPQSKDAA
jgi:hypothetical protein